MIFIIILTAEREGVAAPAGKLYPDGETADINNNNI